MTATIDIEPTPPSTESTLLELRDVDRWFGGVHAVKSVSFTLQRGEILGMIGPNGAGKSTVFNTISGVFPPTAGSVYFKGHEVTRLSAARISRRGLTRTFQDAGVFGTLTVLENVAVACLAHSKGLSRTGADKRALAILESCNLTDDAGAIAAEIPHGHERRLSIAIGLATEPDLLCLDEPLSGLNEDETKSILDLVRGVRDSRGVSVLFIDHNMKAVMQLCDRIVVLDRGEKICDGLPSIVRNDPKMIEAYLG